MMMLLDASAIILSIFSQLNPASSNLRTVSFHRPYILSTSFYAQGAMQLSVEPSWW